MRCNTILKRQNEEKSIMMLAAQRQLYENAKFKNNIYSFILLVGPVLFTIVSTYFFQLKNLITCFNYLMLIIFGLLGIFIEKSIEKDKKLAAFIQQKFDLYIYNMPWNKRIYGEDRDVTHEIVLYSKKILKNQSKKNKLSNWYTVGSSCKNSTESILSCQKENCNWDIELRKRFRFSSVVIGVILITIIFIISIFNNDSVYNLISKLFLILPILGWIFKTVFSLNENINSLIEVDTKLNTNTQKTFEDLEDIQNVIYKHRQAAYLIPDILYNFFRKEDEDTAYKRAEIS